MKTRTLRKRKRKKKKKKKMRKKMWKRKMRNTMLALYNFFVCLRLTRYVSGLGQGDMPER